MSTTKKNPGEGRTMNNRHSLLGKASTITLMAAAASAFGAAGASACDVIGASAGENFTTPTSCVVIDGPVTGDVFNNTVVGPDASTASFLVFGDIAGKLVNNGSILAENTTALVIYGNNAFVHGGITNEGLIESTTSSAVLLGEYATVDHISNSGTITGFIGIDGAEGVTISNGIRNGENGVIHGDQVAISLSTFDGWGDVFLSGGILNSGRIEGDGIGIELRDADFSGGIVNRRHGVISGGATQGTAESRHVAIWIHDDTSFAGGLTNQGLITAYSGGLVFQADELEGDIVNSGTISISGTTNSGFAAVHVGTELGTTQGGTVTSLFAGNISNSGTISGGAGFGLYVRAGVIGGPDAVSELVILGDGGEIGGEFGGEEGGEGGGEGDPINPIITALSENPGDTADLRNSGLIEGAVVGGVIIGGTVDANFTNELGGRIISESGTGLYLGASTWDGNITNAGVISGSYVGLLMATDQLFSQKTMSSFTGDIDNSGTIAGGTSGLSVRVDSFTGNISNSGTITAGSVESVGVFIGSYEPETSLNGAVINSGLISGGTGLSIVEAYVNNGGSILSLTNSGTILGFSNSGTIIGTSESGVGVDILVGSWYGSIENSGTIRGGETGFNIDAGSIDGDFINDGTITGGGYETGVHIIASSYSGNIVNNDLISAPGLALHTEVDSFYGEIVNTGTISSGSSSIAVLLEGKCMDGYYSGGLTNTGYILSEGTIGTAIKVYDSTLTDGILNDGGHIEGHIAIDVSFVDEDLTITNTNGGIIRGNIVMGLDEGTDFVGHDGGVVGYIQGSGGEVEDLYDDDIEISDGTQFIVGGVDGIGDFDVEDGGTALLGTEEEGVDGDGFEGTEVLRMEVHGGGRVYLDDNASLMADEVGFDEDSEVTFFLTANEGVHGSITASGSIGTVTIEPGARLSVVLDAASFAGTQQTDFEYDGVINGGSIVGEFANAGVHGSPFFDLEIDYGSNTLSAAAVANIATPPASNVNLLLHRNSFADLNCSTSTENNEAIGQMLEQAYLAGELTADQLALYQAILNSTDGCAAADAYDDLSGTPFDFIAFQLDGPFKKMVGARIDSGRSTGCIVAGSSGCFNRYAADTTAGSAVMTDATPGEDPFAWLKAGVRSKGTDAVWGRAVGVWGDTDGDAAVGAPGTRSSQRGGIIGADHVFSEDFLAGVAGQYTETRIKFPGHADRVHVNSYEAGAYMSLGDTQGYINANLSYIWHNFDTSRLVEGLPTAGKFDGDTISGYVEAGRIYEAGNLRLQPILALSLSTLSTEGYTEQGASVNRLVVKDSTFDCLKSIVGGRFAYPIEFESGRRWVPEARVSWSHELLDNRADFDARLFSFPEVAASYFTTRGAAADRNALILGTGLNAPISDTVILYADYDATLSSDQTSQTASGGFRLLW